MRSSLRQSKEFWIEDYMHGTETLGRDVFGLYELSDNGTILYSRPRYEDGLREADQAFVGQDFFRDIFPCRNADVLRGHFRRFLTEERPVDTFVFDGLFDREVIRTKIFMTRAYESDPDHAGRIVIMDIRRAV